MSRHPLDMAFAKLERAETHIQDLKTSISKFLQEDPYRIGSDLNAKGDTRVWHIEGSPVPDEIECIAADAVHNVRTPLDKMLSADFRNSAIHKFDASAWSIKFPVGHTLKAFEHAICSQEKHLTDPVIQFLESIQAYPGGRGELFYFLSKLDNADKHKGILATTRLANTKTIVMGEFGAWKGLIFSVGSLRGQHFLLDSDGSLVQPNNALRPTFVVLPPLSRPCGIEFASADGDMELMRTTPDAQVQVNPKPTLTVAFDKLESFEGEPVVNLIKRARKAVAETLMTFRDNFF